MSAGSQKYYFLIKNNMAKVIDGDFSGKKGKLLSLSAKEAVIETYSTQEKIKVRVEDILLTIEDMVWAKKKGDKDFFKKYEIQFTGRIIPKQDE